MTRLADALGPELAGRVREAVAAVRAAQAAVDAANARAEAAIPGVDADHTHNRWRQAVAALGHDRMHAASVLAEIAAEMDGGT